MESNKTMTVCFTAVHCLDNAGYTTFITGGAQGFDQLAFWSVDKVKNKHPEIQNIVYIPFKGYPLTG